MTIREACEQFRRHLEGEAPWICAVFAGSHADLREILQLHRDSLVQRGKRGTLQILRPGTPEQILGDLFGPEASRADGIWLSGLYVDATGVGGGPFGRSIVPAWEQFLLRLHEQRQPLLRRLQGGLVLPVPPEVGVSRVRDGVPELWSARGLVLELGRETVDPVALSELFTLFKDLFPSVDDQHGFLRSHFPGEYREVVDAIPQPASFNTHTEALIAALRSRGLIGRGLFERLTQSRPQRRIAITGAARRFGVDPTPDPQRPLDLEHYVVRPADGELMTALRAALAHACGNTLVLQGPPKSGKGALWRHVWREVRNELDPQVVTINLAVLAATSRHLEFLQAFTDEVHRALGRPSQTIDPVAGSTHVTPLIEELLAEQTRPVLLKVDRAEHILHRDYGDAFFLLLRHWHNLRADRPAWARLTILITTCLPPSLFLVKTPYTSPFNVGVTVVLHDFSPGEVAALNRLHAEPLGPGELSRLFELTEGHPLLVHTVIHAVSERKLARDDLSRPDLHKHAIFSAYLGSLFAPIEQDKDTRKNLRDVLRGREVELRDTSRLFELGVIRLSDRHRPRIRCPLLDAYFRWMWRL